MKLKNAQSVAQKILEALAPHCQRIEIAGSIRRQKPDVKDVEIVAVPTLVPVPSLFAWDEDTKLEVNPGFVEVVNRWKKVKGEPNGKYTQRVINIGFHHNDVALEDAGLPQPDTIKLDLFIATKDNFGLIFAIRTGSADFSQWLVTEMRKAGYPADGGLVIHAGKPVATPDEADVFKLINRRMPSPYQRTGGNYNLICPKLEETK